MLVKAKKMSNVKIRSPVNLSQQGRIGFLLKDSAVYGGAAAITKAFSLVTFPLIARHFSTEDYGLLDFFGVLGAFLVSLIIFGQDSAVARFFYEYEESQQRQRLISQSLIFQLAFNVISVLVLLGLAEPIITRLIDTPESVKYFSLIVLQAPFLVVLNFSLNLLKWSFQRNKFLLISLGSVLVNVTMLVVGIYGFSVGVYGVLCIAAIVNSMFAVLGLWLVRGWLIMPREYSYLKELVVFALPIGCIGVVAAFVPMMERGVAVSLFSLEELGVYAAGARVATLVVLVISAFQTAWGPFSLAIFKQDDADHTYNLVLKLFVVVMIPLVFLLGAIAHPLLVVLATNRYSEGAIVVFPLAMGLVIQATSWITEIGIGISKKSHINVYSYFAYVVTTMGGIYFFAEILGLVGIALGVLLGHLTKAVIATWLAQIVYPMRWHFRPVVLFVLLSLILGILMVFISYSAINWWAVVASYSFVGVGLLIFGVWFLFSSNERTKAVELLALRLLKKS